MKSVMWPLRRGVLQASQAQAIHPDAPCGSQPQQLSVLLVKQLTRMGIVNLPSVAFNRVHLSTVSILVGAALKETLGTVQKQFNAGLLDTAWPELRRY